MAFPLDQRLLFILVLLSVGLSSFIGAQELTDAQIDVISARLSEAAQKRSVVNILEVFREILIPWLAGNLELSLKPFLSKTQQCIPFSQTSCCPHLLLCQVPNAMHLSRSSMSLVLGSYHLRPKTRLVHNHLCPAMEAQQTRRRLVYVF